MNQGLAETVASAGPLGAVAVAVAGIATSLAVAGVHYEEIVTQLENSSRRTGLSIQQYQLLKQAIIDSGGSASGLNISLQQLNRNIALHNPLVEKLHLNTTDTASAFTDLIKHVADATNQFDATNDAMTLMGRGAGELIGSAKDIADGLDATADRARIFNSIIGNDAVNKTAALTASVKDMHAAWAGVGLLFSQIAVGPTTVILQSLTGLLDIIRQLEEALKKFWDSTVNVFQSIAEIVANPAKAFSDLMTRVMAGAHGVQLTDQGFPTTSGTKAKTTMPPPEDLFPDLHGIFALLPNIKGAADADKMKLRGEGGKNAAEDAAKAWDKVYMSTLEATKVIKEKFDPAMDEMAIRGKAVAEALKQTEQAVASSISATISNVILGTESIGSAFHHLMKSILDDVIQSAAQMGIGLGLLAIAPFTGPLAPFVGGVGSKLAGGNIVSSAPTSPSGGDTFIIQTISAKDLIQSMLSPTGQMRSANSRIRELAAVS
jgi:hypothetical protein